MNSLSVPMLNRIDIDKWAYINKWFKYIAENKSVSEDDLQKIQDEADEIMEKYWKYGKKNLGDIHDIYIFNIMSTAMDVIYDCINRLVPKQDKGTEAA